MKKHRWLLIVLALWMALCPLVAVPATAYAQPAAEVYAIDGREASICQLYAYDETPLGQRTPLLLVHGIGAEDDKFQRWDRFLDYIEANPAFNKAFKVYLFRYESTHSVPQISWVLQETLENFIKDHSDRPFKVLAYSEGGLLYRNAMQNPMINAYTEKVITIGTPFHGSPLASPVWFGKQLKETSVFSPVRMTNRLSYWIARKKYPSFQADFQWDNFDQAIDPVEFQKTNGRSEIHGYLAAFTDKFITYGSYFGVGVDPQHQLPKALGVQAPLPPERPRFRNLFSKRFLFSLVRNNISHMPIAQGQVDSERTDPTTPPENLSPLMLYNDGISPISSTLWLGRFTPDLETLTYPATKLWKALKSLKGTHVARLFPAVDHVDWMDGSTRSNRTDVQDLLHPNEPPRTVFQWFVHDLMES